MDYDHCIGKSNKKSNLADLLGIEPKSEKEAEDWYAKANKMYSGVSDFVNESATPRKILVSFETEEDVQEFAKLIGQKITDKTKSIWFPYKGIEKQLHKAWVDQ